jgi:hypothetical protein
MRRGTVPALVWITNPYDALEEPVAGVGPLAGRRQLPLDPLRQLGRVRAQMGSEQSPGRAAHLHLDRAGAEQSSLGMEEVGVLLVQTPRRWSGRPGPLPTRAVFRFRVIRELARAVHDRRARRAQPPADVLDAMVAAAGSDVPAAELAELFLSFLFAVAGSVGFVLGWSVYLLGTHPRTEAKPCLGSPGGESHALQIRTQSSQSR